MKILSGNANLPLAQKISKYLDKQFPGNSKLINASINRFSDGEISIEIHENIRGEEVFIIQPTSHPTNDNVMELLIMIDALKRSSASNITAVIPYFGYARQDRKPAPRTPITAKLIADLLTVAGVNRVLTLDLHAGQIQGFFDIPVDNLFAKSIFQQEIVKQYDSYTDNITIVSPDVGGVTRARLLASDLHSGLAIIDKRREKAGVSEVMHVIGDISGKDCIIFDDIVDSGGTLCNCAEQLIEKGAKTVAAFITHGVLSGKAVQNIEKSVLEKLVITDTIDNVEKISGTHKVEVISVAGLIGEAIYRISVSESVSDLF